MRTTKITFYIPTLRNGGAERVVSHLASSFAECGDRVSVLTIFSHSDEYAVCSGVERHCFFDGEKPLFAGRKMQILAKFACFPKLVRFLKRDRPDILISFMDVANLQGILAAKLVPTKVIVSVRNLPEKEYKNKALFWMARQLFRKADGCVFQTEAAAKVFPVSVQKKSATIFNPVGPSFYAVERHPEAGKIVTCGRLDAQKNHKMLIDAFAIAAKKNADCRLYLYGKGQLEGALRAQLQDLKLESRVFLMGRTDDIAGVLSQAELFVLSSDFEGMPNGLMEAMAAGVPCISTDCPCGGPQALLQAGKNGLLVPVGDAGAMAQAILQLLKDEGLRTELAQNAKTASQCFTRDHICREWKRYVRQVRGDAAK